MGGLILQWGSYFCSILSKQGSLIYKGESYTRNFTVVVLVLVQYIFVINKVGSPLICRNCMEVRSLLQYQITIHPIWSKQIKRRPGSYNQKVNCIRLKDEFLFDSLYNMFFNICFNFSLVFQNYLGIQDSVSGCTFPAQSQTNNFC